jgi:RNA polymerase sigma factor (sigma-70 family)
MTMPMPTRETIAQEESMSFTFEQSITPFETVFSALRGRLVAYARRLAGPELAEDVVQEVFLRLLTYRRSNLGNITVGFMLTITRNVCRTMIVQRAQANARLAVVTRERPEVGAFGRSESVSAELRSSLGSTLEELPERQRDAFILTELRGLSENQAGLALEMSRTAVGARRRAALDKLREAGLEEEPALRQPRRTQAPTPAAALCA